MKQAISVLSVAARTVLYKLLALIVLTGVAEAALFERVLRGAPLPLHDLFGRSPVPLVCGIGFLLLCALFGLVGLERSGVKSRYTIGRLKLRERNIVLLWSGFNVACFLIYWAAQLAIALLLCLRYIAVSGPAVSADAQTVFVSFYDAPYLHSLLPLAETTRWLRNGSLILALSVCTAALPFRQRHGRMSFALAVMATLTLFTFSMDMGSASGDILLLVLALAVFAYQFCRIYWGNDFDVD